jgi:hypothetical protein
MNFTAWLETIELGLVHHASTGFNSRIGQFIGAIEDYLRNASTNRAAPTGAVIEVAELQAAHWSPFAQRMQSSWCRWPASKYATPAFRRVGDVDLMPPSFEIKLRRRALLAGRWLGC